ncbi:hypothetical protein TNCV_1070701 [Trichonephila clavipes]|nr:hypothetical protein TNCV_1070701 [Trichonephila clavipes]
MGIWKIVRLKGIKSNFVASRLKTNLNIPSLRIVTSWCGEQRSWLRTRVRRCQVLAPLKTRRVEELMHVFLLMRCESLETGMPGQVTPRSLDRGSRLRDLWPIAIVLLSLTRKTSVVPKQDWYSFYRPTEGMKGLPRPEFEPRPLWCGTIQPLDFNLNPSATKVLPSCDSQVVRVASWCPVLSSLGLEA